MRIKFKPWAKEYIKDNNQVFIQNEEHLESLISDYEIIYLEIGSGKGTFSYEMAKQNPKVLYIAIERYDSVIVKAGEKNIDNHLENLWFFSTDIVHVKDYKILQKKINNIYLNFSDPWPKSRHEKRRLTSKNYLDIYDTILTKNGRIYLKTDNQKLFEYSIESLSKNEWAIMDVCLNLHETNRKNIKTEYEIKFSELGFRINYAEIRRLKDE